MSRALTGVLLAGGKSSRMGTPKALLDLDGRPLLTHVARALVGPCHELVLSVGTEVDAPADFVDALRRAIAAAGSSTVILARDQLPHRGPVGGLAAALAAGTGEWAFVTGCDSPFLESGFVENLHAHATAALDVVLPNPGGRPEPLLALYRRETMARHFAAQLELGGGSPVAMLDAVRVRRLGDVELRTIDPAGASFVNINDPGDYARAQRRLEGLG